MAANVTLKSPGNFDFKHPDTWLKWKRRFQQYLTATGLDKEDDARKISLLLYCLGDESEDVLTSTNISDDDRKKYDAVVAKFDAFFDVRKNVIYERARFNRRNQLEGESAEQYITCLYSLIETCEYGTLKEELLRDRLIVGIRDVTLSGKLQIDADLTLEKAKKAIRQKEAVHEQQRQLQGDGSAKDPAVVEEVRRDKWCGQKAMGGRYNPQHQVGGTNIRKGGPCMRCGKPRHATPEQCPARNATCFKCNRKGHYRSQCLSRTVAAATQEVEADPEDAFLGMVTSDRDTTWTVKVQLQGQEIPFKMDTGAEVTVISEEAYRTLGTSELEKPSRILYGPARQPLEVLGQFRGNLRHGDSENIFVVPGLHNNLLGLTAITALHLIQRVNATRQGSVDSVIPLISSRLPEYPWQIVGTDLFELDGVHYLLTVDYFSRYPELTQLGSTTSTSVIRALKAVFARHGIPEVVRSDNGPQYSFQEFVSFASLYEFSHITSSPRFPQSNGQVERTVKTVKRMLKIHIWLY